MPYVERRRIEDWLDKRVVLTREVGSISGYFTEGSIVTITAVSPFRGYTVTDDEGHSISEIGFTGFIPI